MHVDHRIFGEWLSPLTMGLGSGLACMYQLQWHWPCIFTATEVISRITDYNVTVHLLLHFTLNQSRPIVLAHFV